MLFYRQTQCCITFCCDRGTEDIKKSKKSLTLPSVSYRFCILPTFSCSLINLIKLINLTMKGFNLIGWLDTAECPHPWVGPLKVFAPSFNSYKLCAFSDVFFRFLFWMCHKGSLPGCSGQTAAPLCSGELFHYSSFSTPWWGYSQSYFTSDLMCFLKHFLSHFPQYCCSAALLCK